MDGWKIICSNSLCITVPTPYPQSPLPEKTDESLLSSDLSIELSHHEEQLMPSSFQEDESDEEEEELPSFLMQVDKSKGCHRLNAREKNPTRTG